MIFWASLIGSAAAILVVIFRPWQTEAIVSQLYNPAIFGSSLSLIFNFMSVLFVLVIFLIQNANQEYSSRLSGQIFKDFYLISILAFILLFSIFNLTGLYFELGQPYNLIGFILSITAVLLIGSLVLFTMYFLDITNIVQYVTDRIIGKVKAGNIYENTKIGRHDKDFTEELIDDTHLFISTCNRAITNDQREVVSSSLDSISRIADQYLKETSGEITDDDYISDVADRFQFIMQTALEDSTKQKYLEDVAEAVGELAVSIVSHRQMGGQNQMVLRLLDSLKKIFSRSYGLELTSVGHVCINKIGDVLSATLAKEGYREYRMYKDDLDELAEFCAETKEQFAAILLQRAFSKYQWQYVTIGHLLRAEEIYLESWQIEDFLDKLANLFHTANENRTGTQRQILYAVFFGPESFNWKMQPISGSS